MTNQRRSTNSSSEFRSFSFVIRNWRTDFRWALCFYLRQDLTTKCTLGNLLFYEHPREAIEHNRDANHGVKNLENEEKENEKSSSSVSFFEDLSTV